MAPSKEASANGNASARAAWNVPVRDRLAGERQRLWVRVHPGDARPPVRQRTRERAGAAADVEEPLLPASGANAATMTDIASVSGGNPPVPLVPVHESQAGTSAWAASPG